MISVKSVSSTSIYHLSTNWMWLLGRWHLSCVIYINLSFMYKLNVTVWSVTSAMCHLRQSIIYVQTQCRRLANDTCRVGVIYINLSFTYKLSVTAWPMTLSWQIVTVMSVSSILTYISTNSLWPLINLSYTNILWPLHSVKDNCYVSVIYIIWSMIYNSSMTTWSVTPVMPMSSGSLHLSSWSLIYINC